MVKMAVVTQRYDFNLKKTMISKSRRPGPYLNLLIVSALFLALPGSSNAQMPADASAAAQELVRNYMEKLDSAPDSVFQSDIEPYFLLILSKAQKQEYLSLPELLDKRNFVRHYWTAYDPDPLLPENDRLLDHLLRIAYARENFSAQKKPFIDDRGRYYIRYGKPAVRYSDPGGIRRVGLFSPTYYERITRFLYNFKNGPQRMYSVPANETWSYENVAENFLVHFVNKGKEYQEVKSLSEILLTRRRAHMAWHWSDLIKRRASVSPALSHAANAIEQFESDLLAIYTSEFATGEKLSRNSAHEKMITTLEEGEEPVFEARKIEPDASYTPRIARTELPFYYSLAQFLGTEGKTRLEIDFFVPVEKDPGAYHDAEPIDTLYYSYSGLFRNRFFQPIQRRQKTQVVLVEHDGPDHFFAVERLSFLLPPKSLEMTVQVMDSTARRLGYRKSKISVRDFSAPALQLSDIQFYRMAPDSQQVIRKNGLSLAVYPSIRILRDEPLYCYFEIYNFKNAGIESAYEVSYEVRTDRARIGLLEKVSRFLNREKEVSLSLAQAQDVPGDRAEELIALDLSSLPGGKYILKVTVSDTKNKQISVSTEKEIELE